MCVCIWRSWRHIESRLHNNLVLTLARIEFRALGTKLHGALDPPSCAMQATVPGRKSDQEFVPFTWR